MSKLSVLNCGAINGVETNSFVLFGPDLLSEVQIKIRYLTYCTRSVSGASLWCLTPLSTTFQLYLWRSVLLVGEAGENHRPVQLSCDHDHDSPPNRLQNILHNQNILKSSTIDVHCICLYVFIFLHTFYSVYIHYDNILHGCRFVLSML